MFLHLLKLQKITTGAHQNKQELSKKTKATLRKKAEKRGLTPGSVEAEYKKGLAAWGSSGSRKGMSQHQWAMARVNSATPSKDWAVVKKSKAKKNGQPKSLTKNTTIGSDRGQRNLKKTRDRQ